MTFKYKKESRVIALYRFLLQTTDESDNLFQLFEELLQYIFKLNNYFWLQTTSNVEILAVDLEIL